MARTHPGTTYFEELHAMDYLAYAYLQLGRDAAAKGILDAMRAIAHLNQQTPQAAYAFAAVPARYALERHRWKEAARLTLQPAWFTWDKYPWAEALTQTARGVGAARAGNLRVARQALARLDSLHAALAGARDGYNWADQVEVERREVAGWMARAEKKDDEALRQLRAAADLEDSIDKNPVTPGALLPAREQLGDLLMELGTSAEAGAAYQEVLKSSPGRRNSLRGLEQAKRNLDTTHSVSSP
jgi:hypothetical protein